MAESSLVERTALFLSLVVWTAGGSACARSAAPQAAHEPVVQELIELLDTRPDLQDALSRAIEAAGVKDIDSVETFHEYVDGLLTYIPVEREVVPKVVHLHYVINQAPDDALNRDPAFSDWMGEVARVWGEFLDTPASAAGIETFTSKPEYRIDDYVAGPSGWLTFNQFFARQLRPGKRPIADPHDDAVIVSPADSVFMGQWSINENSTVTVKGVEWSIAELLDGSPFADEFANGTYMHTFLAVEDYHRYHVPVGGIIREVRNVHGRVYLDVAPRPDGTLRGVNGDTYQFNQERGFVVIESPTVGLVAIVPVGMSFISSVALTPKPGAVLRKGEEFGYFQFGGSDIVMMFQDRNIAFDLEVGQKYLQGQRIGRRPAGG